MVDQLGSGERYETIRPSISLMIVNFVLLENEPPERYKNVYRLLNTISHEPFTDLQEIVILELPKVPDKDDGTELWPWLTFFKCQTMEELDMLAKKHTEVSEAVRQVKRMSPIRAIREMIFEYEDGKRLQMSRDAYVHEQGYKEAEAKYQEQLRQKQAQMTTQEEQLRQEQEQIIAQEEQIRQLEEEKRRLRGE
jgi:hypothetical protein